MTTEPLSDLYRRVVAAMPEAATSWDTFCEEDAPSDFEACAVFGHWQRLCDDLEILIYPGPGWCAYGKDTNTLTQRDGVCVEGQPDRLHALGEALIAAANRSKSDA